MKNLSATLSAVFAALTLALAGLLVMEKQKGSELANQLTQTQDEVSKMESLNSGLEQANKGLHEQIKTMRNAPPMFTLQSSDDEPEREEVEKVESVDFVPETQPDDAGTEVVAEKPEPTPEELARREQQQRQIQAYRDEREKRQKEFRQRVSNQMELRKEFFSQVPMEGLAPEYQEANERLLVSLDEIQSMMDKMHDPEVHRNERRTLYRQIWGTAREASGLMDMQRDVLLNDYAQQNLGLNAEQTKGFMEYMNTINSMTSMRDAMRRSASDDVR